MKYVPKKEKLKGFIIEIFMYFVIIWIIILQFGCHPIILVEIV